MSLTEPQITLLRHRMRGWVAGDFLADFDSAKSRAVAGMGGGTYYLDDTRTDSAWSETTKNGYAVRRAYNQPPLVALTWTEVRTWAAAVPVDQRARIIELGREIRDVMNGWKTYTYRPMADDESRDDYKSYWDGRHSEVTAHNYAVHAAARPLELERDALIQAIMPEPVGEQLELFGGAA